MKAAASLDVTKKRTEVNFANLGCHVQSWYVVARSRAIKTGRAYSFEMLGRTLVCYRGQSGNIYVANGVCPHLGASLALSRVENEKIRCAFHGWCFSPEACDGGRSLTFYPTCERFGLIWMFNGPKPLFDLPDLNDRGRRVLLPRQTLNCHSHIVLANGIDTAHFEAMHGMSFLSPAVIRDDGDFGVAVELEATPRSKLLQRLLGTNKTSIRATSNAIGSSIAVIDVYSPSRFTMLFTGQSDRDGKCVTQTVLFFPSVLPLALARNFLLTFTLLHQDREILDSIEFTPNFTPTDQALQLYFDKVNQMPTN